MTAVLTPPVDADQAASVDDDVLAERVLAVLAEVEDPELPVGLVDLGLVRRLHVVDGHVTVGLTYTSLACPCVEMIREDVVEAVGALHGVTEVVVEDVLESWSRDDLTPTGRALLATVAVV
ncbi:metal-sulfur cluster assembly factor [Salsipaludibacter albus]|uniref:metal-sulfur cluster assembly factor n=1 Tax=Salsipaludibacter albus TaxID=2849650 RepID=UPI001EE4AB2E|nr:iron-sulfur cluster assembly protein [Salsipaludibacter albus]MBY5163240.1 DUF59 domain-containing protein [Salsipaludibacter albus]